MSSMAWPFSSFFSISTMSLTPSTTICTCSTSEKPSRSALEMSNTAPTASVSTPPGGAQRHAAEPRPHCSGAAPPASWPHRASLASLPAAARPLETPCSSHGPAYFLPPTPGHSCLVAPHSWRPGCALQVSPRASQTPLSAAHRLEGTPGAEGSGTRLCLGDGQGPTAVTHSPCWAQPCPLPTCNPSPTPAPHTCVPCPNSVPPSSPNPMPPTLICNPSPTHTHL
uniref:Uncharacterized protein n=1 Tax=Terrapene triunguis TaxID=2587831 RepID=A0A674IPL8_9SAUR